MPSRWPQQAWPLERRQHLPSRTTNQPNKRLVALRLFASTCASCVGAKGRHCARGRRPRRARSMAGASFQAADGPDPHGQRLRVAALAGELDHLHRVCGRGRAHACIVHEHERVRVHIPCQEGYYYEVQVASRAYGVKHLPAAAAAAAAGQ